MGMVTEGWRRLASLLRRGSIEQGLDDEIRFHVEQQTEKNRRAGMTPDDARRHALLAFGGVEQARERTRDEFRARGLEDVWRDLRVGCRALLRAPGFAVVAIVTLALGIGATTAMFSVVRGVLLRPLPYPDQERLVEIVHEVPALGIEQYYASPAIYFGYRDHSRTFDAIGHWDWDSSPATVTGTGEPESVPSLEVTHEILPILGATAVVGRVFGDADDRPGAAPTAVISHGYWQRRFGGTAVAGRTLTVDGVTREIIGVLPQHFRFFEYDADVIVPLQHVRADARFPSGDGRAVARLKPGVTLAAANADVARMIPLLWKEFNADGQARRLEFRPRLRYLKDSVVGDLGETLWILMGTIGLLLVIACANVANLVLVRTQARRQELVVRSALGAGWTAITRVVLAETAVLGAIGGAAGVGLAYLALPFLVSLGADDLPQVMAVRIDPVVLLVAFGIAIVAVALAAGIPLLQFAAGGTQHVEALRGARSSSEGPGGLRTRQLLVVAQVATALTLLIGAGLMIRTFQHLRRVEPGFRQPEAVQTFQLTIPRTGPLNGDENAANRERLLRKQQALLERLAAVGGVESVGFASGNDGLPLDGDGRQVSLVPLVDGVEAPDGIARIWEKQNVSPGLLESMRTRIVAGRSITWDDAVGQRPVMLVSENLARKEWGTPGAALGRRISAFPADPGAEIVGVVEDVHHDGIDQPAPPTVVYPPRATPTSSFVVRSARAGRGDFLLDLRRAIWAVDGELSMAKPRTLGAMYGQAMGRASMTLLLLSTTGALAFVLGLIGVYGVVSYAVSRRRREIGIRLALGAKRGEVSRLFVRHALVLLVVGVVVGLSMSAALTRLITSQLFGVSPLDVPTHLGVAVGLVAAGAAASYISARRGSAMNPSEVLKGD
ncbi:MAG TPA: ABC transporter permease [Luteitalea sp.]|nr:ABC transporter permease [Luteitalea sp.]